MPRNEFGFSKVWARSWWIAKEHAPILVVIALVLTGGTVVADAAMDRGGDLFAAIAGLFAGLEVSYRILRQDHPEARRNIGSYFGASILTGLGIFLGLLLLVIPGVYLAARWSIAQVLTVADDYPAGQAMSVSWSMTADQVWTISLVQLAYWIPVWGSVVAVAPFLEGYERNLLSILIVDTLGGFATVFGSVVYVAIYYQLRGEQGYENVFA